MKRLRKVDESLALEEFKMLQEIARDQEELRAKIRGWCVAIITALSVAALSKEIQISGATFLFVASVILCLFLWLDVLYRVAQDRAFRRAKKVEIILRGNLYYDGPRIRDSLSVPNSIEDQLQSLNNVRVFGPYFLLLIIVTVVASLAP